jgi:hypothetical protein
MVLPNFQPPIAEAVAGVRAVLRAATAQAGVTLAAGRDGPGDHPLTLDETAHLRTQPLDDAHRLMTDGQPFGHRVFAAQDMHVGAANGRGGDAHQRIQRADFRNRLVFEHDAVLFDEDRCFHHGHDQIL